MKKYNGNFLIAPCPTTLVTIKVKDIENVLTISWTGIASSHPEYITISINKKRYSYDLINMTDKFCVNIPSVELLNETDYCGNNSFRDVDKFKECNFTKEYIEDYILIAECKMHILCTIDHRIDLGSHQLIVARVKEKYLRINEENIHKELNPIVYYRPNYYKINKKIIGYYGFTKKKRR